MANQQESRDDSAASAVPLAKGWAMATFVGLMTVALITAFFFYQSNLYKRMGDAQATISRQQHCVAVREACHNQELAPALCGLRQRLDLDARNLGPTIDGQFAGVSCPGAPAAQEGFCDLVRTVPTPTCTTANAQ